MVNATDKEIDNAIRKEIIALTSGIDLWLDLLKQESEKLTPEDTKTLLWNYEIDRAKISWNYVTGRVFNDTEYSEYVEYGVMGRIYKYNKPKWSIFKIWVWARMMTLAQENNRDKVQQIIKKNLWA